MHKQHKAFLSEQDIFYKEYTNGTGHFGFHSPIELYLVDEGQMEVIINDKKETINLTYTTDEITLAQVKVYVAEHLLLGDVYSLPATTIAALDAYLLPLINKYTGSASQMTLTNNTLGTITFSYNGTLSDSFNEAFTKDYSRSTFYSNYISILQNAEDNYEEVYTDWWNNMYKGGSN